MFQVKNKQNLKWKDLDMAKKGKTEERTWISSKSSTKQRHKDQLW